LTTSLAVSNSSAQTTALDRVMRQKLEQSQGMLAAVVTSNWTDLERRSEALIRLTNDPAWMVLNSPEYAKQSQAFLRAAQDLIDAAKRRDLDAAPAAYVSLTLSCVQCHRYVARARIAAEHGRGAIATPAAAVR
jgi:cytochrome c556